MMTSFKLSELFL